MGNKSDKTIGKLLGKLKRNGDKSPGEKSLSGLLEQLHNMGIPFLSQEDGLILINLANIHIFSGLSKWTHIMANDILEYCRTKNTDMLLSRSVDKKLTPELYELNISAISFYMRRSLSKRILMHPELFYNHLHIVFDSLQRARWGGLLFPGYFKKERSDQTPEIPALMFPFHLSRDKEAEYYFLLEYVEGEGFLRITIEDSKDSRLYLKRIPHRTVPQVETRQYLHDIDKIAEQILLGIHNASQNHLEEYKETPGRFPELFSLLISSGLPNLSSIKFIWFSEEINLLLLDKDREIKDILSKILFLFENREVIQLISMKQKFQLIQGYHWIDIDVSRNSSCLNISIDRERRPAGFKEHFEKMPNLYRLAKSRKESLKDVRILLIHHITSQILGLIKSYEMLDCRNLTTLFIKYKGIVPDEYFEALFSLPDDNYRFYSLQKVDVRDYIEGNYILSRQYSSIDRLKYLDSMLRSSIMDFKSAMQMTGFHLFFDEAFKAKKEDQMLLLIEDGGYLSPLINEYCLSGKTLGEVLKECNYPELPGKDEQSKGFEEWLSSVFYGSIEHTRNGFDKVEEVENRHGRLAFPVFSIAISETKNREARVCAESIINAVETVLHSFGKGFYKRNAIIIGSRGNIGSALFNGLSVKTYEGSVTGIDIKVENPGDNQFRCIEEVSENKVLNTDVIIGVTGRSVLKGDFFEDLLVNGHRQYLFIASGSTKTSEFTDLTKYLQSLFDNPRPRIGNTEISISSELFKDSQTGAIQGNKITVHFLDTTGISGISAERPYKYIFLLGDLTPVNFLYYGVPAEIIDDVLCQLFRLSLGVINGFNKGIDMPARLLAVDRDIDEEINIIGGKQ